MSATNSLTSAELTNEDLQQVRVLADKQIALEAEIATMEGRLEQLREQHLEVSNKQLPEAMLDIGLKSFTLSSGARVVIDKYYSAKIPEDKYQEAFKWLRDHGHEGLIKRNITCKFGKGEDERATALAVKLAEMQLPFEDKTGVHPQTLKAFVRESIESAKEIPMDLLGAYVGTRSKIAPATA